MALVPQSMSVGTALLFVDDKKVFAFGTVIGNSAKHPGVVIVQFQNGQVMQCTEVVARVAKLQADQYEVKS
jgi:hypothetical protein